MITDAAIAQLLVELYNGNASAFDVLEPGQGDSGVCWASKRIGGADVICLRGSVTFWDWFKDLLALATPWQHDTLGPIHPGFAMGMDRCWAEIKRRTQGPWIISGHSLGAGRAAILTGLMIEDRLAPLARIVFGEPKPGFSELASYIQRVIARSYRNGDGRDHDTVTDVPISFPPEEYIHPSPLLNVSAIPDAATAAKLGVFRFHHMPLYAAALKALEQ